MPLDDGPDAQEPATVAGALAADEADREGGQADGSAGRDSGGNNWSAREPSNGIAMAVARLEGIDISELPPLYGSIDTEGLDALLQSAPNATVTFPYRGYEVTVTGRGEVELVRLDKH